jgi:radical SAM protein with 4Fe4S-binding SPASM domain
MLSLLFNALISRFKGSPFDLEFAVTYKCNLRCVQCNIWRYSVKPELSLKEIYKIFSSYKNFKVLGITGGEPFLRNDLPQIIDVILQTQKKLKTLFITTNGQLPWKVKETVESILKKYRNPKIIVLVSIDGPKEIHNGIRGVSEAYEKALTTIELLAGLRRLFSNFSLGTVTVCSPFNINFFDKVIEEIKDLKRRFLLETSFPVWFQGQLYKNLNSSYNGVNEFRKALINFIPNIKLTIASKKSAISKGREVFYDLLKLWLKNPTHQVVPCEAAKIRFFLDPYGNVYPCTIFNFIIGNLKEYDFDFKKLFKSSMRNKARELIEHEKCPICCNTCETIPSMMAHPLHTLLSWIKSRRKEN